jgi:hypothetical protein
MKKYYCITASFSFEVNCLITRETIIQKKRSREYIAKESEMLNCCLQTVNNKKQSTDTQTKVDNEINQKFKGCSNNILRIGTKKNHQHNKTRENKLLDKILHCNASYATQNCANSHCRHKYVRGDLKCYIIKNNRVDKQWRTCHQLYYPKKNQERAGIIRKSKRLWT